MSKWLHKDIFDIKLSKLHTHITQVNKVGTAGNRVCSDGSGTRNFLLSSCTKLKNHQLSQMSSKNVQKYCYSCLKNPCYFQNPEFLVPDPSLFEWKQKIMHICHYSFCTTLIDVFTYLHKIAMLTNHNTEYINSIHKNIFLRIQSQNVVQLFLVIRRCTFFKSII